MTGTVYEVIATRSGDWWALEVVSGLPPDVLGVSQARRLSTAPKVARSLIADLLELDPDDIEVQVSVSQPMSETA